MRPTQGPAHREDIYFIKATRKSIDQLKIGRVYVPNHLGTYRSAIKIGQVHLS